MSSAAFSAPNWPEFPIHFQPVELLRLAPDNSAGKAFDAVVATGETKLAHQVLVNRRVVTARVQLDLDEGTVWFAQRVRPDQQCRCRWPGWGISTFVPVATPEEFAGNPVLGAGEFGSGPSRFLAMLRMVLRSTPVSFATSRWLAPLASGVATVVRLFGFKTYTSMLPFDDEGIRLRPASGIAPMKPCSGTVQAGIDPKTNQLNAGGVEEQARQVLANLKAVLAANSMTLDDVVATTVYVKDLNDFAKLNAVYASYFQNKPPARATVQVARLPKDALVEISAIASK